MEIEFKFEIPRERLISIEADMVAGNAERTRLQAHYFDTASGALAKQGIVLRLRQEGSHWMQTAKAISVDEGPMHRLEHNFKLHDDAKLDIAPDVQRHAGTAVGKLIRKVLKCEDAPLLETFATDISRLACVEQLGSTRVELALDVGKVMSKTTAGANDSYRESPVCELELELVEGNFGDLVALAGRWSQRHGLWLSTLSKSERGERLSSSQPAKAVKATRPHFPNFKRGAFSGAAVQRSVFRACLAQVLPNASEAASGNENAEVVHQLRVGLRRLRTALRELDGLSSGMQTSEDLRTPVSDFDPTWEPALTEVFRVLGAQRDQQLLTEQVLPKLHASGAPAIELVKPTAQAPSISEAVRAEAFQAALVSLVGFASSEPAASTHRPEKSGSPVPVLRARLAKLFRQIARDGKKFETLTPEAQHRVRKRLKRLRYLSEFTGALFSEKDSARFVAHLTPAQDALGKLNDEAVALTLCRQVAVTDPKAWFAVGWLSAEHSHSIAACTTTLAELADVSPFWKKH